MALAQSIDAFAVVDAFVLKNAPESDHSDQVLAAALPARRLWLVGEENLAVVDPHFSDAADKTTRYIELEKQNKISNAPFGVPQTTVAFCHVRHCSRDSSDVNHLQRRLQKGLRLFFGRILRVNFDFHLILKTKFTDKSPKSRECHLGDNDFYLVIVVRGDFLTGEEG